MGLDFDADKLYLTKSQILAIGDRLIQRWKQNETANRKMILITKGAQFVVNHYKAEEIEMYYKEFWKEAYNIMYENVKAGVPELKTLAQVGVVSELDTMKTPNFSWRRLLAHGAMKD